METDRGCVSENTSATFLSASVYTARPLHALLQPEMCVHQIPQPVWWAMSAVTEYSSLVAEQRTVAPADVLLCRQGVGIVPFSITVQTGKMCATTVVGKTPGECTFTQVFS